MRKTFQLFGFFALLALAVPLVASADAAPVRVQRLSWESGANVGSAGGAVATTVLTTEAVEELQALVRNASTTTARVLTVTCLADNGTTVLFTFPTVSVSTSTQALVNINPAISSATAATGTTNWPARPCRRMKFSVAAAGSDAAELAVYGR